MKSGFIDSTVLTFFNESAEYETRFREEKGNGREVTTGLFLFRLNTEQEVKMTKDNMYKNLRNSII